MTIGWWNAESLRKKTDDVNLAITERSLDVLALTETWHTASDDSCLRLATPSDYAVVDVARPSRRGGGIAVIFRKEWKCATLPAPKCSTFEVLAVRLTTDNGPVVVVTVYRPGSDHLRTLFFDELSTLLEMLVVYSCPVLVGGDFNIHAQSPDDPGARRLADLLASFDMVQHVHGPTQRCGNTLDLVMTPASCKLDSVDVEPPGMLSDHSLIICQLPFVVDSASVVEKLVRGWRRIDRNQLRQALEKSELCQPPPSDDADVDQLFATYDTVLRGIADRLAPQHSIRRPASRLSPWFDAECRTQRRQCRRLERRYRKTGTATDRRLWVDATRRRILLHRRKKEEYWRQRLEICGRSSTALWRSMSTLLG